MVSQEFDFVENERERAHTRTNMERVNACHIGK